MLVSTALFRRVFSAALLIMTVSAVNTVAATFIVTSTADNGNLCSFGSPVTITRSTFIGGFSTDGSALFFLGDGLVAITNSTIGPNNNAMLDGAIWNSGPFTMTGSTVSGNTSGRNGGGVYRTGAPTLSIQNSTIVNNTALGQGGGIRNDAPILNLRSTLVANNSAAAGPDVPFNSQGYNLVENPTGATGTGDLTTNIIGLDPIAGPLQNNGGLTFTVALLTGSPAIDKGSSFGLAMDQRKLFRTVDFGTIPNATGGDGTDIGSFEVQAVATPTPPPGGAKLIYAYNLNNDHLISFVSNAPGTIVSDVAITGLRMGEVLIGIDFRPASANQLYGVATSATTSRVLTIDIPTGATTQIGNGFTPPLSTFPYYGFDFNPAVDRIRIVNEDNLSIRLHPTTGALVGTDTPVAYAPGDPSAGQDPRLAHAAYDQNFAGTTQTTLYAIDFANDNLVRMGGVNGNPSPNGGLLTTIGPLGIATNPANGGFDIQTGTGNAFAVLNVNGVSNLYTINLITGLATLVGPVGGAPFIDGMTIARSAPANTVQFPSQNFVQDESQIAMVTINRPGDTTGTTMVTYSTSDGTATGGAACTSGVDYINVSQVLTFGPGVPSQTVSIVLCPDRLTEPSQTINLALTNPSGTGLLGTPNTAVLTINDAATQFTNTAPITINSGTAAAPYPSTIVVSNAAIGIGSMRVTLFDFSHLFPDHVDILLVGPRGQEFVIMGDAGGPIAIPDTAPVTLSLSDLGTTLLPNSGPLVTCQCEPTTWETPVTDFPATAPTGPYDEARNAVGNGPGRDTFAEVFGGTDANGTWSLFVRDDNGAALPPEVVNGIIAGGWGIEFFGPTAANVSLSGRVSTAEGNGLRNARVTITGNSLSEPRVTTTGSFGTYSFEGLEAGRTYVVTVNSKRFTFQTPSRVITVADNVTDADFIADSP